MRSGLSVAAASVALLACSALTSLDGLTGGGEAGGLDAGHAGDDASASDGASPADATPRDDGAAPDAGDGAPPAPTVLASSLSDAYAIAVDATYVYFTTTGDGRVGRVTKSGGAPDWYAVGESDPQSIALDGTSIFWSDFTGNAIVRCAVASPATCLATPPGPWQGTNVPDVIATDGTSLFWSSHVASGNVYRRAIASPLAVQEPVATTQTNPAGIALDGATLAWVEKSAGRVDSIAKSATDGTPTVVTSDVRQPIRIAAAAGYVFWTDAVARNVASCPITGCAVGTSPAVLASGLASPQGIAASSANGKIARVVWVDRGGADAGSAGGTIVSCSAMSGTCLGSPAIVASAQDQPTSVALDDTSVYWTTKGAVLSAPWP